MASHMYIAGSFGKGKRGGCGNCGGGDQCPDNDPHFWTDPPTWGICRPDLRERTDKGEYVFFVSPKNGRGYPQTIFAYMKIADKITHFKAYKRSNLHSKRMSKKMPNGNIIVNGRGGYNKYDRGVHRKRFERIKANYAIGDPKDSRFLGKDEMDRLAPYFLETLKSITGKQGSRAVDIISRYGLRLDNQQAQQLIAWIS